MTFGFAGALNFGDLGSSASAQLEVAPAPWWYASATAGVGQAGALLGGGGLHLRWVLGAAALSAGVGVLYEGARYGTDTSTFFGTSTTMYHYPAIAWGTAETSLAVRDTDGLGLEVAVGIARPFAAAAYTCTETDEDPLFGGPPVTSDCSHTVSNPETYVEIRVRFPATPSW